MVTVGTGGEVGAAVGADPVRDAHEVVGDQAERRVAAVDLGDVRRVSAPRVGMMITSFSAAIVSDLE